MWTWDRLLTWGRLHPVEVLVWIAVVLFATVRPAVESKPREFPVSPWRWLALAPPMACLLLSFASFVVRDGHPTVQLGSRGGFFLWHHVWSRLLIACLAGCVHAVVLGIRARTQDRPAADWFFVALANVISLYFVFGNFPSA